MKKSILILTLLSLALVFAQSETEFRTSASLRFSPLKKVKLYVSPELRFRPDRLDKVLLGAEVRFDAHEHVNVGGAYAFITDFDGDGEREFIHRIDLYAEAETEWWRFTPSFRLMYSSYDEDEGASNFLRYKIKLDYDIPKCKIDPFLSAELYHQPVAGTYYKMRYGTGADWRFAKKHSIGLAYKLDDYLKDNKLKHVIELGYSFKF